MQMHGRATARLALVPTDQLQLQPKQISAQRTPKGRAVRAWHSGESAWPLLTASR